MSLTPRNLPWGRRVIVLNLVALLCLLIESLIKNVAPMGTFSRGVGGPKFNNF